MLVQFSQIHRNQLGQRLLHPGSPGIGSGARPVVDCRHLHGDCPANGLGGLLADVIGPLQLISSTAENRQPASLHTLRLIETGQNVWTLSIAGLHDDWSFPVMRIGLRRPGRGNKLINPRFA